MSTWNAYRCLNDNIGVLIFETQDDDKYQRMISPIYVNSLNMNSTNKINTFMDHTWDGIFSGQNRLGRWPSIIETGPTLTYQIVYTGTEPQTQRFMLDAEYSATVLRINYTSPGAYAITD